MSSLMDGNNIMNTEQDEQQQTILGSPCSVRAPDGSVRRGHLLEVRYLWTPLLLADTPQKKPPPLYGFVRVKDLDHRLSGWFPTSDIELKEPRGNSSNNNNTGLGTGGVTPPPQPFIRITKPLLSSVYWEETPGMSRTRGGEKPHDFFEERLLRDCRTPTTIRYFVYLCKYVFTPWYYAPYGIFHAEYDPAASCSSEEQQHSGITETTSTNPYIRDAYLCPFSLRIYSTFEQMQYETRHYRSGRLQPPGQEIYRDEARGFSMFEVNGSRQLTYCRHLFLLGKSFLENKLAGYDVQNYYFYIVCFHQRHFPHYTDDPAAMYFAGYFTWEKQVVDNNLACIVTLPCFASGSAAGASVGHFGHFMIAASYELAYRRRNIGSPEKPLSDLGAAAYHRYWLHVLVEWMHTQLPHIPVTVVTIDDSDSESETKNAEEEEVASDDEEEEEDNNNESILDHELEVEEDGADENNGRDNYNPSSNSNRRTNNSKSLLRRGRATKRSRSAITDHRTTGASMTTVTVRRIAHDVRLDPADVLRTLLRAGLLHRNAEDHSLRLVIPAACVRREMARASQQKNDLTRAVFNPSLLLSRGATTTTPTTTTPTAARQQQTPRKQIP